MKKIFLYLFMLASAGVLLAEIGDADLVHMICKPAIMITLGLHYWITQRDQGEVLSKSVVLAIIFSCAGDTLLMFQGKDGSFFMLRTGRISCCTHLLYSGLPTAPIIGYIQ
jgi:uncharacterized membrane protein YhhN